MKSSTRNIELHPGIDLNQDPCGYCKALKADVDVRGGRARGVSLRCEVADEVDTADEKQKKEGMPIGQICKEIRAKMIEAGHLFNIEVPRECKCSPLRDAIEFLKKHERKVHRKNRPYDLPPPLFGFG